MKAGTGARALNSIVKTSISVAAFDSLGSFSSETKKILISEKCVDSPKDYVIE
jgi:ATP-dependent protease Clp ATPase subunit